MVVHLYVEHYSETLRSRELLKVIEMLSDIHKMLLDVMCISGKKKKSVMHQRCESRVVNMWMDNVTLTFDLQTSISIGFLLSPSGMCVPRFIYIRHFVLKISCGNKTRGSQEPVIAHLDQSCFQ